MHILKTIFASIGFIPMSVIGQFFSWYFAIFCLFMWNISVRVGVDGNFMTRLFTDFFPYIMAGSCGGGFAAFGVRAI